MFLNILSVVIALIGATAGIAGLNDDGRARLANWFSTAARGAYRVGRVVFVIVAIGNGTLGVVLFGIDPSPPTRKAILTLLMFLINIGFGLWAIWKAADSVETARTRQQ